MKLQTVSCLILAGGESKRMNHSDKGLILFKGRPLVEHIISALEGQVDDFVISANRNIDTYRQLSSTVIADVGDKNGPLSGIAAALPACQHELVLVVPCDMPNLPTDLVEILSANLGEADLSIIEVHNRTQLVFLMRKSLLASVQHQLLSSQYKLMHWVKSCSPAIVDCSNSAEAFLNINSLQDINQT